MFLVCDKGQGEWPGTYKKFLKGAYTEFRNDITSIDYLSNFVAVQY